MKKRDFFLVRSSPEALMKKNTLKETHTEIQILWKRENRHTNYVCERGGSEK